MRWQPGLVALLASAAMLLAQPAGGAAVLGPEVLPRAFWVDSTTCSVLLKSPIDASKPLQAGTPLDLLISLPAICTSSVSGQAQVAGGVRSLLVAGFRVTSVSHAVTALPVAPGETRVELLVSALFALERPQATLPAAR